MSWEPSLLSHLEWLGVRRGNGLSLSDPSAPLVRLLILGVMGVVVLSSPVNVTGAYPVEITDFERDLIAAEWVSEGRIPYQSMPAPRTQFDVTEYWVAHTPFSLALARGWLVIHGSRPEAASAAGLVEAVSLVLVIAALAILAARFHYLAGLAVAAAAPWSMAVRDDASWLQGAAIAALAVILWLRLADTGHGTSAAVVAGLAVAWRPWLAPLALLTPLGESRKRDAVLVLATAALVTGVSLPFVGGWEAFIAWITQALPRSSEEYLGSNWNLSPVRVLGMYAWILAGAVTLTGWHFRKRLGPTAMSIGSLVVVSCLPFVWTHYWLAVLPAWMKSDPRGGSLVTLTLLGAQSAVVLMGLHLESSWVQWTVRLALAVGVGFVTRQVLEKLPWRRRTLSDRLAG